MIYKNAAGKRATVPFQTGKGLHLKVLRSILHDTGLSIRELQKFLKRHHIAKLSKGMPPARRPDKMLTMQASNETKTKVWRPSQAQKSRAESGLLSSHFRGQTPILRSISLATGFLLICAGTFVFWVLWRNPNEKHLHEALALVAGGVILLLALAVVVKRIRRPKRDDQSVLKL